MLETDPPAADHTAANPNATRAFGRFELRQLLGKSDRTMVWLAFDPRSTQELMMTMPRVQPVDVAAQERWTAEARKATRITHPNLAHAVEIGVQDHWPYVAVDRALGVTLVERLAAQPQLSPAETVEWLIQLLQGLAFAHEAGVVHGDLQLHHLLISEQGVLRVMGLAAAGITEEPLEPTPDRAHGRAMPLDPYQLRVTRQAAVRDVLTVGVLMHHLLCAQPALDEHDTHRVLHRLPPLGRELVRLPWTTPQPVPEALRAIANRTTTGQERLRYHNARTLLTALEGWREAAAEEQGGALALLIDRLRTVGHLPAGPNVGARVARLAVAEGQRTDEMAEQVLQDMALSFELLRNVNSAHVQGSQISGNGPVLTIRRAIALVGLKGLRHAAAALRPWPGPLDEDKATALQRLMDRTRMAGHLAQELRPAGYDPEVIYLVAALQNLGRLLVQYHFPDEAEQIQSLLQTLPPPKPGEAEMPGMSEENASYAVLGVDVESLGAAVARHWGLNDEVLHMIRRLSLLRPVRQPDSDGDALRIAASAANEIVDVVTLTAPSKVAVALAQIAQRYGRVLTISSKDIAEALQAARSALKAGNVPGSVRSKTLTQDAAAAPSSFQALLASRHSNPSS